MPKGDRFKLKADPEDGTTPIANLLLEAVAMAKISGLQKGAILYLWRRTYGWADGDKRVKERKIALSEWLHALDSTKSRVPASLADLEGKNIIKRRMVKRWEGYYYSMNWDVASWGNTCLNLAKLMIKPTSTLRLSYKYQRWHDLVIKNNPFCCKHCGRGVHNTLNITLHVHHIKSFALYPELRFDVNNGIILCDECHRQLHKNETPLNNP